MAKKSPPKTNAARMLDAAGVPYRLLSYEPDLEDLSATHVAEQIGLPPERVFKTLVARGDRGGVLLAIVPGHAELDLKAAAAASGNKKVELVALKEIQALTGYVRGGVSPLGGKKDYPVYLDASARQWPEIAVSAGLRGLQLLVAPGDLARITKAIEAPLAYE